jgi:hypothetical protein
MMFFLLDELTAKGLKVSVKWCGMKVTIIVINAVIA